MIRHLFNEWDGLVIVTKAHNGSASTAGEIEWNRMVTYRNIELVYPTGVSWN
jgi:hypothetical protein